MKLNVGVLMGGKSIEHEVSFNSGRTVCDHLDTTVYNIIPIYQTREGHLYILPWRFLYRGKTTDFVHRLQKEAQHIIWDDLKHRIDFMYIAVHGRYAEDGTLQGILEVLDIPYLGSKIYSSALGMDKIVQKDVLKQHGIEVPRDVRLASDQVQYLVEHEDELLKQLKENDIDFPCVVKPCKEGSSLGMTIVKQKEQLGEAVQKACCVHPKKKQSVLIEEQLQGMEFSCIILTDYKTDKLLPLPPTEIVPEPGTDFFDYEQKYMPGRSIKFTPARCSQEDIEQIQQTCIEVMRTLEITNMMRCDGFLTSDGRVVIIDPNSLSGMGPSTFLFRQAAEVNMSHTQLINHLIETELHTYGIEQQLSKSERTAMKHEEKMRVAILLGGKSNEKEISLESGRNVTYKLSPQKYEPIPIFVNKKLELFKIDQALLVRNSTKEIEEGLERAQQIGWNDLPTICDFVFIALHGGEGENGAVQGTLEMLGLPYNGSSVLTSALCMDKYKTTQFLKGKGFDVPQSILVTKEQWLKNKKTKEKEIVALRFPLIIKPHDDGCSILVKKITTEDELTSGLKEFFDADRQILMCEEFIEGMELTVGVIGNAEVQVLPPSQAISAHEILSIEEKFLPGEGENQTPAPLPEEIVQLIQQTIEKAYKALGCKGYARIDCFYDAKNQRVILLEVNTLPGMTPATCIFHQAAEVGIRPMDFIDQIIQLGLQEHGRSDAIEQLTEQKVIEPEQTL